MNFIDTLGWTLIHFLWQGTLIALALAAVHGLMRNTTSRARYAVACGAMVLMLFCAIGTFARLYGPALASGFVSTAAAPALMPAASAAATPAPLPSPAAFSLLLPWLVYFWMAGVGLLTLRSVGGWAVLQDFKRRQTRPAEAVWQQRLTQLGRRLRISRTVKLCESALAQVPSVIGWLRPVILMPVCALNGLTPEQLEGLLAHELAHIRQNDYLVNLFQTCVETLLFYHPAVWWVGRRIRAERENCCDDMAVEVCGDALAYARALTQLEQIRGSSPQLAMAANGGSLLRRVQRLLLPSRSASRAVSAGWVAGTFLALVVVAGWAAPRLAHSDDGNPPQVIPQPIANRNAAREDARLKSGSDQRTPAATTDLSTSAMIERTREIIDHRVSEVSGVIDRRASSASRTIERMVRSTPSQAAPATAEPQQQPAPSVNGAESNRSSFVEEMDKAGYHNLSVDQLIAMKIHGVTPEFIREMRAEGYQPTPDQLVAFKIHGVTPQYIDQFKGREWKLDVDHLVAFRIHGVDPAQVQAMAAQGYQLNPDQAVAMRIHGITPEFAAKAKELGLGNPTFDQLLALKIHGADSQFLAGMKEAGIRGLDFNTLVALKIHGVDPGQVKEFAELGFKDLSAEELVAARIYGVTPDYIREIRKRGFKDLTLEQIIKLKQSGILENQRSL